MYNYLALGSYAEEAIGANGGRNPSSVLSYDVESNAEPFSGDSEDDTTSQAPIGHYAPTHNQIVGHEKNSRFEHN